MKEEQKTNKEVFRPVIVFFTKTTSWVAIPAVLAFLIKSYVEMSQTLFFILVGFSFIVTIYGIYREIKMYQKTLDKETK